MEGHITIEQILDCSAAQLEAMTDEQLTAHLSKYFIVTRPEQAARREGYQPGKMVKLDANGLKGIEVLKQLGLGELAAFALTKRKK